MKSFLIKLKRKIRFGGQKRRKSKKYSGLTLFSFRKKGTRGLLRIDKVKSMALTLTIFILSLLIVGWFTIGAYKFFSGSPKRAYMDTESLLGIILEFSAVKRGRRRR